MTSEGFEVGDRVKWRSGAAGKMLNKTGEVVEVVEANQAPTHKEISGALRKAKSYVVKVDQGPTRKALLYWPRAELLKLAGAEETTAPHSSPSFQ